MSDLQAIADRFEIEALRGEFTDALMMRDYDRFAWLFTQDGAWRIPYINVELVGWDLSLRFVISFVAKLSCLPDDWHSSCWRTGTRLVKGRTAGRTRRRHARRRNEGKSRATSTRESWWRWMALPTRCYGTPAAQPCSCA